MKLGKIKRDLVPLNTSISNFAGGATNLEGILIMNLTGGSKTLTTPFFVVNAHSSYNLLLGEIGFLPGWQCHLHYQCLVFWNDEDV